MRIIFATQLLSTLFFSLCVQSHQSNDEINDTKQTERHIPKGPITKGYLPPEKPKEVPHTVTLPKGLVPVPERKIIPAQ